MIFFSPAMKIYIILVKISQVQGEKVQVRDRGRDKVFSRFTVLPFSPISFLLSRARWHLT